MTTKFQVNIKFNNQNIKKPSKNFLNKFFFDSNDAHMAWSGVLTLPPPQKKKHPKNITPITPVQKKVYPSPGIFYPLLCLILKPFNCRSTGAKNMKKSIYYKSLLVNKTINTKKQIKPKENKPYY